MASSADLHNQIATQHGPADDLPCADFTLLAPLKKSADYRTIRPRIANPQAIDSWQEDDLHFFVFELRAAEGAASSAAEPPVTVFTMHPEEPAPISVVVVTPSASGEEAEIMDVRQPETAYSVPVFGNGHRPQDDATPSQNGHDEASASPDEPASIEQIPPPGQAPPSPGEDPDNDPVAPIEPVSAGAEAPLLDNLDNIASQDRARDDARDSDVARLVLVEESPEYQAIYPRLVDPRPTDSWQEDGLHFFVFQLRAEDGAEISPDEAPVAVFTMHPEEPAPISVVVVAPGLNGEEAEIVNLRQPENSYALPV